MKFAFLGYHTEPNWTAMSKGQQDAMIEECFAYDARLLKEGHVIPDGAALQATRTARTLRWRDGKVVVTDGPFAETKEQLGGVGQLEAADMAQAVELMSKHPGLRYGSTFEIRPIDEAVLARQQAWLATYGATAPAAQSSARRFASLGYIGGTHWDAMPRDRFEAMINETLAFEEARIKNGQWLTGIALQGPATAKTLRGKAGRVVVTDGPFAETKEYLGGLKVLAFESFEAAIGLLSAHPALPFGVVIEIRPINDGINEQWDAAMDRANSAAS